MSRAEPMETVLNALKSHGIAVKTSGTGFSCCCPAHEDRNPSLSVTCGDEGNVLIHCFAGCTAESVCASLGLGLADLFVRTQEKKARSTPCASPRKQHGMNTYAGRVFPSAEKAVGSLESQLGRPSARWEYHDEQGRLVGLTLRFETGIGKTYRPVWLDPSRNGWVLAAMGAPRPLYGLGQFLELAQGSTVYVCEGEKAADAGRILGLTATTSAGGSNAAHFADWRPLAQMHVIVFPDRDKAGEKYAKEVARLALEAQARSVRIIRLAEAFPELSESGDLADIVEMGTEPGELRTRIESLVVRTAPEELEPSDGMPVLIKLNDVEPESIDWLWPGKIARGKLTVLAGDPGLGKSFVTLDIAARLTCGLPWPDAPGKPIEPGGVVLLGAEDGIADTIRPRLDAAGADVNRIVAIKAIHSENAKGKKADRTFDLTSDIRALEAAIQAVEDCKLVIIDPISAYLGGTDSHKNGEIRGLLAPLANLADKQGLAILAVTHLNKNAGGAAIYRTMGSIAFTAAARAAWIVTKDNDDPERRLLLPAKNNLAIDTGGLAYRLQTIEGHEHPVVEWEPDAVSMNIDEVFSQQGAKRCNKAFEEARLWLLDALGSGPIPAGDIKKQAQRDGIAQRTLDRAKDALGIRSHKLGFGGDGHWVWELSHSAPLMP